MASYANHYTIYLIAEDGGLVKKCDHTDDRAACLTDPINIVLALLQTDKVKSAFLKMTTDYCEVFSATWFLEEGQGTRKERIRNVVRDFLKRFSNHEFPILYISDRFKDPDALGETRRSQWFTDFSLSSQRMVLNGVRLQMMVDFSKSAAGKEGPILNAYRTILLQFAVTIFHEIGHVFFTYLGKGGHNTPPTASGKQVESGFRLEQLVFGGEMVFARKTTVDISHYDATKVCMRKRRANPKKGQDPWKYFELTKNGINSTIDMKFQLPFNEDCVTTLKHGNEFNLFWAVGDEGKKEVEDPSRHPEWFERLAKIDPERLQLFKEILESDNKQLGLK